MNRNVSVERWHCTRRVHSQSSSFAFRSRVQGVMFYLDGLFVSQNNVVPPDPLPCFASGAGVLPRPPPGLGVKECGCKMYLGYSRRGQRISVIAGEPQGIVSRANTHTHARITIHTFPPICCRCFPTPTPLAKHVWHNAYGNSRTRLPMTKTTWQIGRYR